MKLLTPKEKAKQLVDKFYNALQNWVNYDDAKKCAIITIEEIQQLPNIGYSNDKELTEYDYCIKVIKEIKLLYI